MTIVESSLVPQDETPQGEQKKKRRNYDWREYSTPKHETPRAYAVYLQYRDLGPRRSILGLIEYYENKVKNLPPDASEDDRYVPGRATLQKWQATFNWYGRVREYDDEQMRLKDLRRQELREQMDKEHYDISRIQFYRTVGYVDELVKRGELSHTAAVAYAKMMATLQRLAAGAPTEKTEQTTKVEANVEVSQSAIIDPRKFTDEELEQLREMAIALKQREQLT